MSQVDTDGGTLRGSACTRMFYEHAGCSGIGKERAMRIDEQARGEERSRKRAEFIPRLYPKLALRSRTKKRGLARRVLADFLPRR